MKQMIKKQKIEKWRLRREKNVYSITVHFVGHN